MTVQAQNDYVWIERSAAAEEKSAGGIVLPKKKDGDGKGLTPGDDAKVGVVVSVGFGVHAENSGVRIPMLAQVGRKVVFVPRRSLEVEVEGRRYWVTRDRDILATLSQP